ncbi:MAG: hypothetical protein WCV91_07440 [Candidatus Margulisiibacteriota bacterium]
MVFLTSAAFAKTEKASLNATGYDWLGYAKEEKTAFAELLYAIYGIDKNKNAPVNLIKTLDDFYYTAIKKAIADPLHVNENEFLKIRCVDVISRFVHTAGPVPAKIQGDVNKAEAL